MNYIKTIRETIDATLDRMQSKSKAAELQAALGRMELETRFGEQYQKMSDAAALLHDKLNEAGFPEEEIKAQAQKALDNLQLQLTLGGMETRDGVERLKQELDSRVSEFNRALDGIDIEQLDKQAEEIESAVKNFVKKVAGVEAELDARADQTDNISGE